jgi:hypothetical protein
VTNLDGQRGGLPGAFAYIPSFLRGDPNGDGAVDLSDALKILFHLFAGGSLACDDAADIDDDENLNLTDAIALLEYLFRGGPPPRPPFPGEGLDPSGSGLGCGESGGGG